MDISLILQIRLPHFYYTGQHVHYVLNDKALFVIFLANSIIEL